jgi:hypothetical protein
MCKYAKFWGPYFCKHFASVFSNVLIKLSTSIKLIKTQYSWGKLVYTIISVTQDWIPNIFWNVYILIEKTEYKISFIY